MNKMNEHKNLKKWCERHYENTNIRVHPTNVPLSSILDEVLGRLEQSEVLLKSQALLIAELLKEITKKSDKRVKK